MGRVRVGETGAEVRSVDGIFPLQPLPLFPGQIVQVCRLPHVLFSIVVRVVELLQGDRVPGSVYVRLVPSCATQVRFFSTVWAQHLLVAGRGLAVSLKAFSMGKVEAEPGHQDAASKPDQLVLTNWADHN